MTNNKMLMPTLSGNGSLLPDIIDDDDINSVQNLADLNFNDIYISSNGRAFMRGLETKFKDRTPSLTGVPRGVIGEVARLQKIILKKGESSNSFFEDFNKIRFRVTKIESVDDIWFALRRSLWPIPRFSKIKGIHPMVSRMLGSLGSPNVLNNNNKIKSAGNNSGLILFCGETGSGKTTTACSLLQEYLLAFGNIATTIEDPIELKMAGSYGSNGQGRCFQYEIVNDNFEYAIKNALRQTPRYIFFGEIRGKKEAKEALMASINGHIVISTIHSGNVQQGVDRIISLASEGGSIDMARKELASGIRAIIHQKLLFDTESSGKILDLQSLFIDKSDTRIRNLIENGDTKQLTNDLERQAIRISKNMNPVDYD